MTSSASSRSFTSAALAAFPVGCRSLAHDAARALADSIDGAYETGSISLEVLGERVYVPQRLHFHGHATLELNGIPLAARCLVTRATDGHLRQRALKAILDTDFAWSIPFIVLLAGDYVVEIVEDIRTALPMLNRVEYSNFVRENRATMDVLQARAASYWNCYYRADFPARTQYPGMIVLRQLEEWAS